MPEELKHSGTKHHSGRYPWGSGEEPYQRAVTWRSHIQDLKEKGLSDLEIAENEGIKTHQLRARMAMTREDKRRSETSQAISLKDKGYSNVAIGKIMKQNESSIRNLLNPVLAERAEVTMATANMLKENVDAHKYLDIGAGIENHLGVSRTKLNNAVSILVEQGYKVHTVHVDQVGMPGKFTIMKAIGTPDSEWKELKDDPSKLHFLTNKSEDFGRTYTSDLGLKPIQYVDSKRIKVIYGEEGGGDRDGVIELRRGVEDLNLGKSKYAQVK